MSFFEGSAKDIILNRKAVDCGHSKPINLAVAVISEALSGAKGWSDILSLVAIQLLSNRSML